MDVPASRDDGEVLYFIDSHAHLDMVLERMDTKSQRTKQDFVNFFNSSWTEDVIRDLYTAQKEKKGKKGGATGTQGSGQGGRAPEGTQKNAAAPRGKGASGAAGGRGGGWSGGARGAGGRAVYTSAAEAPPPAAAPPATAEPAVAVPRMRLSACIHVCCFVQGYPPTHRLADLAASSGADEYASRVFMTYGVHPHAAKEYDDKLEQEIEQAMSHPRTVAWGECGLDYFKNFSDHDVQRAIFARQLQKAVEHKKPLVIHSRDAEADMLKILNEHVPSDWKIHMHCFGESPEMAAQLLATFSNVYFGFTGAITFASAGRALDVVKMVPLNRLLLETDCPFMAPEPHRGKVAQPAMIPLVARKVAELKGLSISEVICATSDNARTLYSLPETD